MHDRPPAEACGDLAGFRQAFYGCLTARPDALFELAEAVLCADGPVRSLVELSLVGEHRRGHGSLYAALARGRIDVERLRNVLAAVPLPRAADGRLVLAVDITCWLRPDANTSPERILFTPVRAGVLRQRLPGDQGHQGLPQSAARAPVHCPGAATVLHGPGKFELLLDQHGERGHGHGHLLDGMTTLSRPPDRLVDRLPSFVVTYAADQGLWSSTPDG